MAQNEIGISGIGYNPCYNGQIKHFLVKKTLKRRMVSGMTDDIFQKSHLWVKSKKGCILTLLC